MVRKQAEALLQSVNNLIAVVKEPEVQQALIEVQAGLQRVLDKFNSTGMRDIDSLIEIVSELRISPISSPLRCRPCRTASTPRPVRRARALRIWQTSCNCRTA